MNKQLAVYSKLVSAVLCLTSLQAAAAGCQADVTVKRFWEEKGGFVQKASVRAKVQSARPGAMVKVRVELRFQYVRSDGWSNWESAADSRYIKTQDTSVGEFVLDTRVGSCSVEKPCTIKDVEVHDVSCYD